MARPRIREGQYERIALDVRKDLLDWLDAHSGSRREIIEASLEAWQAKEREKERRPKRGALEGRSNGTVSAVSGGE